MKNVSKESVFFSADHILYIFSMSKVYPEFPLHQKNKEEEACFFYEICSVTYLAKKPCIETYSKKKN